jgi:hypothetical protein
LKLTLLRIATVLLLCTTAHANCPPGDLNGDCRVDAADLALFAHQWLTRLQVPADLNRDGRVNGADLSLFAGQWRQTNCPIVINELLAHAHAEASDWIELHNTGTVPVHIGGWFLSDNKNDLKRYEIAMGTTIGPHGYMVFYETTHFGNPLDPRTRKPFAFTENGEAAYLYSGEDKVFPNYLIEQPFGASETGYSFGRYLTSLGTYDFVTMSKPTPGEANAYPRVGPLVINEVMYRPAGNADAEYMEILNISGGPVTLFDFVAMEPWRLMDDSGIDLWFPADPPVTLRAGEAILLIRSPTAMRQYSVPAGVRVFAWGPGKLDNAGGKLQLLKPGDVDEWGMRYWIEVDHVDYSDGSHGQRFPHGIDPWPIQADGFGFSLNRLIASRYGNDPNNWQAAIPTPGSAGD